jgi:putative oxidoreductase
MFALWVGRVALAVTLLSAVADRFGLWGPPGSARASWGDWAHFVSYCGVVNSFAPKAVIPALAWIATGFEIVFGVGLLIGYKLEYVAYGAAVLFALFAFAMTWSVGVKEPLNYSVFADAGGALLLGALASAMKGEGRSERGSYSVADAGARWAED